jgi:hypothetical protein
MTKRNLIVVSAENNPYIAWQCKLFHYSCVSRLGQLPLFIVHETDEELSPDFHEIIKAGGTVRTVPNYRQTPHTDEYPCRNIPASLLHAAELCRAGEQIVLCDPDMLFARDPQFPAALAGCFYSYINFDHDFVEPARLKVGVSREAIDAQKEALRCGGPYVVPVEVARPLAKMWLEAVEAFHPRRWEDVMYAYGLAVIKLGLRSELLRFVDTNHKQLNPLESAIIHYCYGDERWNKRQYFLPEKAQGVWRTEASAPRETILGEILTQIREAASFYQVYW